ncbi:signal peptidase II [Stecheria sp. CLA-KB-P133]|uniref:Lipoprotein signal peptidase n=1 Tax=Grylomicrobium aquisgranensis TaxID=2926318 RepID=A0AB35U0N8_9FIRM|nr:signal peptidase II [Lactimicrobium massiliense]MDX8419183.1 signal peptidase II [Stecheria sp. CLA-KB-P133]MDD6457208.1 signal peptidase II [Lactimicrobium massiliense]MDD6559741.1 signal peptidase II [Lactimicrobium massiliense]MDD6674817.1 signal peptidase II [Lactimicrobium massiliense]MDD6726139.1 signal peptidase II [Lactimicrobium massiliense]
MTAAIIVVIVLVLDQLTKFMVQNSAVLQTQSIPVIPKFFYLTYVQNTGAAWSVFADKTQLLALVSAVAVGVMLWYVITRKPKKWILFALALMIGGAAGNMIDRIWLGYVRDFFDFYPFGYNFPVFNVADIALTIGVIMLILASLKEEDQHA